MGPVHTRMIKCSVDRDYLKDVIRDRRFQFSKLRSKIMKDNALSNILNQHDSKEQIDGQLYTLNLGPTHPATHGIFQNVLTMDGERILHSEQTIGYIHRAYEKISERRNF